MTRRFVLLAAAVALVAAACGGSDDNTSDAVASLSGGVDDALLATAETVAEPEESSPEDALFAFAGCMRDNGLDIEDPTVDADGNVSFVFRAGASPQDGSFDREAARAAREACSDLLEGVALGFGRGDVTELQDTLFEYAECMRENGYEMADPDFSNLGPGGGGNQGGEGEFIGPFAEIDPDDPAFAAADEACSEILSGFGAGRALAGRPGGGPGGGGGRNGGGNG